MITCDNAGSCSSSISSYVFGEQTLHYYDLSSDMINLGFAAILFAVAVCLIVGARIVWLQQIGKATHTPVSKRK